MKLISPRHVDFAGFPVRRLFPTRELRAVGPWLFLDHMGPHRFAVGAGVDVPPHPHINLATVTYLFEGEIVHRDSIGNTQPITPGAINLMVAGSGIAHSERTAPAARKTEAVVHGLQLWHGLPADHEEDDPLFLHYPQSDIPETHLDQALVRVLIGSAFGLESPVRAYSPTLYAELRLDSGGSVEIPIHHPEQAVYLVEGDVMFGDTELPEGTLASQDEPGRLTTQAGARIVVLGGASLGKRYMWWNYVSSRIDRIEQARIDWDAGRFGPVVDDEGHPAAQPEADRHSRMK